MIPFSQIEALYQLYELALNRRLAELGDLAEGYPAMNSNV